MSGCEEAKMDFGNHPCFNAEKRHSTGRIHLPVAQRCNIQCNFCNRKYDCVNESRPGVTSRVLTPMQAVSYLESVLEKTGNISVVGIAGPGDPFANPEETLSTLERIREKYKEKVLCVATNGLGLPDYVDDLARLAISHVTVTVNTVDPEIGKKIYPWVRLGRNIYRGAPGAEILLERQTEGIKRLKAKGLTVKINTVIIPGINDSHAEEVARYTAGLGADIQNCIPMMHVEGTVFETIAPPEPQHIEALRLKTAKHLAQMSHCARCRADAAGIIGGENPAETAGLLEAAAAPKPDEMRPYVAVASMEGLFVNRHLGEATQVWIFGIEDGKVTLKEQRPTPPPGSGDRRWLDLARILHDCVALQVSDCGKNPKEILEKHGVQVMSVEGLIADTVSPILEGRQVPGVYRARRQCGAGVSCGGTGMGCG
ncbi:MAG: radical SAM protein [Spirochaetales bacterium]|jgi:nitrogen fixation protein NifB|nr:radical SAM protein [Spirochaetales bacterium]